MCSIRAKTIRQIIFVILKYLLTFNFYFNILKSKRLSVQDFTQGSFYDLNQKNKNYCCI